MAEYTAGITQGHRKYERSKRRKGWTEATIAYWQKWDANLAAGDTPNFESVKTTRPDGYSPLIKRY